MVNAGLDCMLGRRLNTFLPLSAGELNGLAGMQFPSLKVKRGSKLIQEGQTGHQAFVLLDGWACSSKVVSNGGRQILSVAIAGDCVGLGSAQLQAANCSIEALTDAVVNPMDRPRMLQTFGEFPRLRIAVLCFLSLEGAMIAERLVSIGRRSAIARMAHFFAELAERLTSVGLATPTEFKFPLTQYVLGDALGLSAIHVNRVLHQLRDHEVLTLRHGAVQIHDVYRLRMMAGLDAGNLSKAH
jgi:CRP-like cAMP-binding protein